MRSYRAAFRVEQNRAAAQELRRDDPDVYSQILAQATGTDAEEAARRDPDAYVALFLAEARDAGVIGGDESISTEAPKSDREYWPHLHLQAVNDRLADFFTQTETAKGGPVMYPIWAVRRQVAIEVLATAGLSDPQVSADVHELMLTWPSLMVEDPQLEETVERLLQRHHLRELVQILVDGFTAPGRSNEPPVRDTVEDATSDREVLEEGVRLAYELVKELETGMEALGGRPVTAVLAVEPDVSAIEESIPDTNDPRILRKAASREEISSWLRDRSPDWLLVVCNGYSDWALQFISAASQPNPNLVIFVLASESRNYFFRRVLEAGADDIVTLPATLEQTRFEVQHLLRATTHRGST
jgi:hypothetical protein